MSNYIVLLSGEPGNNNRILIICTDANAFWLTIGDAERYKANSLITYNKLTMK